MSHDYTQMAADIRRWAIQLGFTGVGITGVQLDAAEAQLLTWLDRGYHGEMAYMQHHGTKRSRPAELVPGTLRVVSVRMNYLPGDAARSIESTLADPDSGYIARYALGRDYHKVLRQSLQRLANRIAEAYGEFGYRAFTDSAPVLEKPLGASAGLGWIGKHTNLLDAKEGSWFFIGELFTDLPLPVDEPASNHCGSCRRCMDACPTHAIVDEYQLDARRCLSYHTIELHGPIPVEFRKAMGNRILAVMTASGCVRITPRPR